jgi:von Willebrand factor type A domain
VTIWSSSQFRHPNRAIIGAVLAAVATLVCAGWQPAFASPEEPRVIAIHTASAPRVSVVVEVPGGPSGTTGQLDDVSVWIRDTQVPTTVTPMASDALSVALVIDTASETSVETLQRAQSGATELLLRLPPQAHSMVITAGGDPRIVAPLTPNPGQALSAVSELRPGGERSTVAAVMVAAQKLADAPAGPHAIVVYANGADGDPTPVESLIEAVMQVEAVVSVIQHGQDRFWPPVLARTGGAVMPAGATDIVQSYRHAATALSHQYLVTFTTPGALPVQARLVLRSDGVSATTTVELPRSDPRTLTETTPSDRTPGPISAVAVLVLLSVLGLLALLRPGRGQTTNSACSCHPCRVDRRQWQSAEALRDELGLEAFRPGMERLVRSMTAQGIVAARAHVEVDTDIDPAIVGLHREVLAGHPGSRCRSSPFRRTGLRMIRTRAPGWNAP